MLIPDSEDEMDAIRESIGEEYGPLDARHRASPDTAKLPDDYMLVGDTAAIAGDIATLEGRASDSFTELDAAFRLAEDDPDEPEPDVRSDPYPVQPDDPQPEEAS